MTDWKVPSANVAIDSGHFTAEVYGYVLESGVLPNGDYAWKCLKGDRAPHYTIEGVRMPFTWSHVDPYMGTQKQNQVRPIRQILFSKSSMLDRAEAQMRGLGAKLEIPAGEDQLHEYQMQLTAYERFEKAASNGEIKVDWVQKRPDDHWGSTFRMAVVCGVETARRPQVNRWPNQLYGRYDTSGKRHREVERHAVTPCWRTPINISTYSTANIVKEMKEVV